MILQVPIQEKASALRKKPSLMLDWLVVEPTHLKNMIVKLGSSSPIFGVKIKNIWVATT